MALKKAYAEGGISGEYWRIDTLEVYKDKALVCVSLYVTAQLAASGARPLLVKQFQIPNLSKASLVEVNGIKPKDPYKNSYSELKKLPLFEGAVSL